MLDPVHEAEVLELQDRARACLRERQLEEARGLLERALAIAPDDPWTRLYLGNWHIGFGSWAAALQHVRSAAAVLPELPHVYTLQAQVLLARGELGAARQACEQALSLAQTPDVLKVADQLRACEAAWREQKPPYDRAVLRSLARNQYAVTTALLSRRYLLEHPDDVGVRLDYAEACELLFCSSEAIRVLEATVALIEPTERWPLFAQLGGLHRANKNLKAAQRWYRRAIDARPDETCGYILLGGALAREGRLAEAEQAHRTATGCATGLFDEAYLNLGLVLRGQGRLAAAAVAFRRALDYANDQNTTEALQDVEQALAHQNAPRPTARESLLAAFSQNHAATFVLLAPAWLQAHPRDVEVQRRYAQMLCWTTRYAEAAALYRDTLRRFPEERATTYRDLGDMGLYRGQPDRAAAWLRRALQMDPDDATSWSLLAQALAQQGKLAESADCRRTVIALRGEADDYLSLARTLCGLDRLDEAQAVYRQAQAAFPQDAEIETGLLDVALAQRYVAAWGA